MAETHCIIVGGGLVGLFTANYLTSHFDKVTIVEQSDHCGGLMCSWHDEHGLAYDYGTHVPNLTRIDEIDEILFGPEQDRHQHWNLFESIFPIGHNGGQWNEGSSLLDARVLAKEDYHRGLGELLSLNPKKPSASNNLRQHLEATLGETFTDKLMEPVIQKLYGVHAEQLVASSSVDYFGLSRVMVLDREITNKLRELPEFSAKLSCHTHEDYYRWDNGRLNNFYLYPKHGKGVEYWIKTLEVEARKRGVEIVLNRTITAFHTDAQQAITQYTLDNEDTVRSVDQVIWTAPPAIARRLLGHSLEKNRSHYFTTTIFNQSYDRALLNQRSVYVWNWEAHHRSFRITLYPNLDPTTPESRISVEVLSTAEHCHELSHEQILAEMVEIGVVHPNANIIDRSTHHLHRTFPLPTRAHVEQSESHLQALESTPNLLILGRYAGRKWFQSDVLIDAYQQLKQMRSASQAAA